MRKFTTCALSLLLAGVAGCGESQASKINRATSEVNVLAEKLSEMINDDGWFNRVNEVGEIDPWDNRLRVKYERHGARETLTVRSNGPDGLPLTKDDIAARYHLDSDKAREARGKEREKAVEGMGKAVSRGLTRGVFDAVKETMTK